MITIQNLSKQFGSTQVLRGINTTIHKGEVIAVIGPSGSGKSTFLRCLNLLETPTAGNIIIGGIPLLDPKTDIPKVRQRMGMVFQSFNLWSHLTVTQNLTLGPIKLLGKGKDEAEKKALELLKLVGLAEKADSFPDELSGGQKQRVAIARCMAMEPEILLFDEPTSALDPTMVSEVLSVIRRLSKEGLTMVIVTHEMEFARNTATRVFYMDEGVIYEEGTATQIFDNPQREKTKAFINRIRSLNFTLTSKDFDLYAMQGEMGAFCEKHFLSRKVSGYVQHISEEVLGLFPEISRLDLSLSYSEKDGDVILRFENTGKPFNPVDENNQQDEIALKLIKARSKSIAYYYESGVNTVILDIQGT